jgi:hypothetical protein
VCCRYHQKVPDDPPELELKATYGLVSPNEVPMPSPSPLWSPQSYAAFDTPKTNAKDPANSVRVTVLNNLYLIGIKCSSRTEELTSHELVVTVVFACKLWSLLVCSTKHTL